jgi:TPP-dependent trihydroxycyclohexane-1,2-dione (THcHDO) dehydratase
MMKSLALVVEIVMLGGVVPLPTAGILGLLSKGDAAFAPETPKAMIQQSEPPVQASEIVPEKVDVLVKYQDRITKPAQFAPLVTVVDVLEVKVMPADVGVPSVTVSGQAAATT